MSNIIINPNWFYTPTNPLDIVFYQEWHKDTISDTTWSWLTLATDHLWNSNKALLSTISTTEDYWTLKSDYNKTTWYTCSIWLKNNTAYPSTGMYSSVYYSVFWTGTAFNTPYQIFFEIYNRSANRSTHFWILMYWTASINLSVATTSSWINSFMPINTRVNFILTTNGINSAIYKNWALLQANSTWWNPDSFTTNWEITMWKKPSVRWFDWTISQTIISDNYLTAEQASYYYSKTASWYPIDWMLV
jgi:hypothetical protein